jgi:hypothetical protein
MTTAFREKWAILVGPQEYKHIKPLQYSTADIVDVGQMFRQYLDFKDDNILEFGTKLSLEPLEHVIQHELGGLLNCGKVHEEDLLVFYFSGHGFRDNKDYLLPVEASPNNLKRTAIEFEDLVSQLTDSKCNNIVLLLDMCREAITGERGIVSIGEESRQVVERAGFATIFSCEQKQLSFEIDELQHGSFTHCFLEGIKSGKYVSLGEMYQYLVEEVPTTNKKYGKPSQRPYPVQAGDKWNLPIFLSSTHLAASAKRFDELDECIKNVYARGEITLTYFETLAEFLADVREKQLTDYEKEKLNLLERLCKGKLKTTALRTIWEGIEKRRLLIGDQPPPKPDLGKLE